MARPVSSRSPSSSGTSAPSQASSSLSDNDDESRRGSDPQRPHSAVCGNGMVWYGAPPTPWTAIVATRWWLLDRVPTEHTQTESVPSALVRRWVSFPQGHSPAVLSRAARLAPFLSVLSGSSPAQRDAELHGRPVCVEADQLELAREIVPVGVSSSSAARCVDPRRRDDVWYGMVWCPLNPPSVCSGH
jgi:hypothetical protein